MRTQATRKFQEATDEKPATVTRSGWNWSRIRPIAFWTTTLVIALELAAGSVWNLLTIEWVEVQLHHLGYPHFFAYILGAWQAGAAVAIVAPGLRLLKEWAYVGAFFLWSGAVASHLSVGDGLQSWGVPLMFGACAIASWVLRPADRRLPETRLRRARPADAGPGGFGPLEIRPRSWASRPRAWIVPIGLIAVLYAVSFLTLPVMEDVMREQAVELGWIDR
ncbi:DoxX family protein [Micromonospora sp. NBC_00821]|uniref:DoxX family protein n=1 Tax=Micromonospora sp. NBC_00821 TaxID=2975977 RepID=UPI002ED5D0FB|nr:DoxX family protein [Micromonospora sp. NBC_00821]